MIFGMQQVQHSCCERAQHTTAGFATAGTSPLVPAATMLGCTPSERGPPGTAGKPVYAPERERILGQRAKRTERLAKRAARRSRTLALAYSASLAGAYLLMAADTLRRVQP